jgi:hypothetical protein
VTVGHAARNARNRDDQRRRCWFVALRQWFAAQRTWMGDSCVYKSGGARFAQLGQCVCRSARSHRLESWWTASDGRAEGLRPFGHGPLKVMCRYSAHFGSGSLVRQFIELNYIHFSTSGTDPVRYTGMGAGFSVGRSQRVYGIVRRRRTCGSTGTNQIFPRSRHQRLPPPPPPGWRDGRPSKGVPSSAGQ